MCRFCCLLVCLSVLVCLSRLVLVLTLGTFLFVFVFVLFFWGFFFYVGNNQVNHHSKLGEGHSREVYKALKNVP